MWMRINLWPFSHTTLYRRSAICSVGFSWYLVFAAAVLSIDMGCTIEFKMILFKSLDHPGAWNQTAMACCFSTDFLTV
jgi:hypothetical protein